MNSSNVITKGKLNYKDYDNYVDIDLKTTPFLDSVHQ